MPLIDSFLVDHTIMPAPSVRLAKVMKTPKGDEIEVWDLRFKKPNTEMLPERGLHTLEHLLAGFMREHINLPGKIEVIDISPMGCKTGFYMSLVGHAEGQDVALALKASMEDIVALKDDFKVPAANAYQCGSFKLHSLLECRKIAQELLDQGITVTLSKDIALDPNVVEVLS